MMAFSFAGRVSLLALLLGAATAHAQPLPRLQFAPGTVTVSGVSSGGYLATQLHVAHSRLIAGAGIVAAGPWYCAENSTSRALGACMDEPEPVSPATRLAKVARAAAAANQIDDLRGLAGDRVWVFHGARDRTVARPVTDALVAFYRQFVPPAQIAYVTDVAAAHGFPTLATGGACDVTADPFLNACRYDTANALLTHLYGPLRPAATNVRPLQRFAQAAYTKRAAGSSLAAEGFLYVPARCADGAPCRLHVVLHGCRQGADFVGDRFARDAGYNRWAESNGIVVLYPQARRSSLWPFNPQGCWDWWGYEDSNYAYRSGSQVAAIRRMIEALGAR